jgi:hypothetical protein
MIQTVLLVTADKKEVRTNREPLYSLSFLQDMTVCEYDSDEEDTIPLPNINATQLQKIIAFVEYYHTNPYHFGKICMRRFETGFSDYWYSNFFDDLSGEQLIDLFRASYYMIVHPLYKLAGMKIVLNKLENRLPYDMPEEISINLNERLEQEALFKVVPRSMEDIDICLSHDWCQA